MEPFRKRKMYYFEGKEMHEIPVDDSLVQLDGIEKSIKHNKLLILCEKRQGLELYKFIRILDLDTFKESHKDIKLSD